MLIFLPFSVPLAQLAVFVPPTLRHFQERAWCDRGVDLLFCNEEEARAYTGQAERETACRSLAADVGTSCVTCGAEGAILYAQGRRIQIPGFRVEAVDTTGAGDLFAGGVLFGITNGFSLEKAGKLGSYAAAQVVAQYGPRLRHPLGDEIGSILARD